MLDNRTTDFLYKVITCEAERRSVEKPTVEEVRNMMEISFSEEERKFELIRRDYKVFVCLSEKKGQNRVATVKITLRY